MEITVNNKNYQLQQSCSVEQMLTDVLDIPAQGLAVAINQTIITKSEWPDRLLEPGDQVVLIKATQGG